MKCRTKETFNSSWGTKGKPNVSSRESRYADTATRRMTATNSRMTRGPVRG